MEDRQLIDIKEFLLAIAESNIEDLRIALKQAMDSE